MHYPINAAAFVAEMQEQFRHRERAVEFCRTRYIPAMNEAYRYGKAGVPGYPLDPVELVAFEEAKGPLSASYKRLIEAFADSLNAAYAQGAAEA